MQTNGHNYRWSELYRGGGGVDGMVIPMIRSDLRQIGMGCFAYTFLLQVQSENDDLNYVFQVYFMF